MESHRSLWCKKTCVLLKRLRVRYELNSRYICHLSSIHNTDTTATWSSTTGVRFVQQCSFTSQENSYGQRRKHTGFRNNHQPLVLYWHWNSWFFPLCLIDWNDNGLSASSKTRNVRGGIIAVPRLSIREMQHLHRGLCEGMPQLLVNQGMCHVVHFKTYTSTISKISF